MLNNQKLENELFNLYQNERNFIHKLLDFGLNVPLNVRDSNKNTLLHRMIMAKDQTGADLLLNYLESNPSLRQSVLNAQNDNKNTAIHLAVQNDLQLIAKKLDNMGIYKTLANN